jgi:outer membrane protein assembly factor BamD (BamD/ComL family)
MNSRYNKIFFICLVILVSGCQSFWQNLDEAEYNEVETLYTKGLKAKKAQEWEEAYRYLVQAYAVASTRGGILRFPEEPEKNNYIYTFKLISRKMEKVAEHLEGEVVKKIGKEEDLGKSMGQMGQMKERQQSAQKNIQQEMFVNVMKADKKFTEAEELARREKYLEAILLLEKYIDQHRTEGEADQARKLVDEYGKLLDERRKELYDAVGLYLKKNNFPMAKELLHKMKETYPPRVEFKDALIYIDKLLKDINAKEEEFQRRLKEAEQEKQNEQPVPAAQSQ